jgi:hypothetical protein
VDLLLHSKQYAAALRYIGYESVSGKAEDQAFTAISEPVRALEAETFLLSAVLDNLEGSFADSLTSRTDEAGRTDASIEQAASLCSFVLRLMALLSVGSAMLLHNGFASAEEDPGFSSSSEVAAASGPAAAALSDMERRRRVFGRVCVDALSRLKRMHAKLGSPATRPGGTPPFAAAVLLRASETSRDLLFKRAGSVVMLHGLLETALVAAVSGTAGASLKGVSSACALDAIVALNCLLLMLRTEEFDLSSPRMVPMLRIPYASANACVGSSEPLVRHLVQRVLATLGDIMFKHEKPVSLLG